VVWLPLLVAACAVAPPPAAPVLPIFTPPPAGPPPLTSLYESAVRQAAVRDPSFTVKLLVLPRQPYATLVNFSEWGAPPVPTSQPVWASDARQLAALCKGRPDAVLALEEALGLPPRAKPEVAGHQFMVTTLLVPTFDLFRPCPGGTSIAQATCGDVIAKLTSPYDPRAGGIDPASAYFLLAQIWGANRVGFADWGYPFTGMGWTYDWDPAATSPVGVTAFVIRPGSFPRVLGSQTPRAFCAAPDAAGVSRG